MAVTVATAVETAAAAEGAQPWLRGGALPGSSTGTHGGEAGRGA